MAKKTNTQGECTLCHAKMDRAEFPAHIAKDHGGKDHASGVINESNEDRFWRVPLKPKVKDVTITPEEHAIIRRFNALKIPKSVADEMNWFDLAYGFLRGAGLLHARAHEFALLDYGSNWFEDPIFKKSLAETG